MQGLIGSLYANYADITYVSFNASCAGKGKF